MTSVRVTRSGVIPDRIRIARYEKSPELGPRILFFSGGTALNALSRHLTRFTHNSIHVITSFDSGGSSARLRDAFPMPSVGDLRSRIMALADRTVKGHPEIVRLFAYRFPKEAERGELNASLRAMSAGGDALVRDVPYPMRDIIRAHLRSFLEVMPPAFDLRGASVGNLILAGGYLRDGRDIDPVVFLFSRLVEARGTVVPVYPRYLELGAVLHDGRTLVGQHRISGKECPPIDSPIDRLFLHDPAVPENPVEVEASEDVRDLILQADLICFPMGSFFSSVLVNLLPTGVAEAVRENGCPKVYIPNTGGDPEEFGMTVDDCITRLNEHLSAREKAGSASYVNFVVLDSRNDNYRGAELLKSAANRIPVVDTPLITPNSAPFLDEQLLVPVLLSLT